MDINNPLIASIIPKTTIVSSFYSNILSADLKHLVVVRKSSIDVYQFNDKDDSHQLFLLFSIPFSPREIIIAATPVKFKNGIDAFLIIFQNESFRLVHFNPENLPLTTTHQSSITSSIYVSNPWKYVNNGKFQNLSKTTPKRVNPRSRPSSKRVKRNSAPNSMSRALVDSTSQDHCDTSSEDDEDIIQPIRSRVRTRPKTAFSSSTNFPDSLADSNRQNKLDSLSAVPIPQSAPSYTAHYTQPLVAFQSHIGAIHIISFNDFSSIYKASASPSIELLIESCFLISPNISRVLSMCFIADKNTTIPTLAILSNLTTYSTRLDVLLIDIEKGIFYARTPDPYIFRKCHNNLIVPNRGPLGGFFHLSINGVSFFRSPPEHPDIVAILDRTPIPNQNNEYHARGFLKRRWTPEREASESPALGRLESITAVKPKTGGIMYTSSLFVVAQRYRFLAPITSYSIIDQSKTIIGDLDGRIYLIVTHHDPETMDEKRTLTASVIYIGQKTPATSISYLYENFFFLASKFDDSLLFSIHQQPLEAEELAEANKSARANRKGKGKRKSNTKAQIPSKKPVQLYIQPIAKIHSSLPITDIATTPNHQRYYNNPLSSIDRYYSNDFFYSTGGAIDQFKIRQYKPGMFTQIITTDQDQVSLEPTDHNVRLFPLDNNGNVIISTKNKTFMHTLGENHWKELQELLVLNELTLAFAQIDSYFIQITSEGIYLLTRNNSKSHKISFEGSGISKEEILSTAIDNKTGAVIIATKSKVLYYPKTLIEDEECIDPEPITVLSRDGSDYIFKVDILNNYLIVLFEVNKNPIHGSFVQAFYLSTENVWNEIPITLENCGKHTSLPMNKFQNPLAFPKIRDIAICEVNLSKQFTNTVLFYTTYSGQISGCILGDEQNNDGSKFTPAFQNLLSFGIPTLSKSHDSTGFPFVLVDSSVLMLLPTSPKLEKIKQFGSLKTFNGLALTFVPLHFDTEIVTIIPPSASYLDFSTNYNLPPMYTSAKTNWKVPAITKLNKLIFISRDYERQFGFKTHDIITPGVCRVIKHSPSCKFLVAMCCESLILRDGPSRSNTKTSILVFNAATLELVIKTKPKEYLGVSMEVFPLHRMDLVQPSSFKSTEPGTLDNDLIALHKTDYLETDPKDIFMICIGGTKEPNQNPAEKSYGRNESCIDTLTFIEDDDCYEEPFLNWDSTDRRRTAYAIHYFKNKLFILSDGLLSVFLVCPGSDTCEEDTSYPYRCIILKYNGFTNSPLLPTVGVGIASYGIVDKCDDYCEEHVFSTNVDGISVRSHIAFGDLRNGVFNAKGSARELFQEIKLPKYSLQNPSGQDFYFPVPKNAHVKVHPNYYGQALDQRLKNDETRITTEDLDSQNPNDLIGKVEILTALEVVNETGLCAEGTSNGIIKFSTPEEKSKKTPQVIYNNISVGSSISSIKTARWPLCDYYNSVIFYESGLTFSMDSVINKNLGNTFCGSFLLVGSPDGSLNLLYIPQQQKLYSKKREHYENHSECDVMKLLDEQIKKAFPNLYVLFVSLFFKIFY